MENEYIVINYKHIESDEDKKRREEKIEKEQAAWEEKAAKESLPGFDPSWYYKTPEEIAEEVRVREGNK